MPVTTGAMATHRGRRSPRPFSTLLTERLTAAIVWKYVHHGAMIIRRITDHDHSAYQMHRVSTSVTLWLAALAPDLARICWSDSTTATQRNSSRRILSSQTKPMLLFNHTTLCSPSVASLSTRIVWYASRRHGSAHRVTGRSGQCSSQ